MEKTKKGFNYNKILIPAAILVSAVGSYYGYSVYNNLSSELNKMKNVNDSLMKTNNLINNKYNHSLKAIDGLKQQISLKQSRIDQMVIEFNEFRENFMDEIRRLQRIQGKKYID